MKSIEEIKLQNEKKNFDKNKFTNNNIKIKKNKEDANGLLLRNNLLRYYYENNERINETLAENNSEN